MSHTPGPWEICYDGPSLPIVCDDTTVLCHVKDAFGKSEANALLIAAAPELLSEIEREYIELSDLRNNWIGRNTLEGQEKLCRLSDLLVKATGRSAKEIQDDYGTRAAKATNA